MNHVLKELLSPDLFTVVFHASCNISCNTGILYKQSNLLFMMLCYVIILLRLL
jgi:hypothetical protein